MLFRVFSLLLLAGALASPAWSAPVQLMPGATFEKHVEFTRHGPVVINVIDAPKPNGGLFQLRPALATGAVAGVESLAAMQRKMSASATVAGISGDSFTPSGVPSSLQLDQGVVHASAHRRRSSVGIEGDGDLRVDRVELLGTWQGSGQRRVLGGVNRPPTRNGVSLYTPAWGARTPRQAGASELVLRPFPAAAPNRELTGVVSERRAGGGGTTVPSNGAVIAARGAGAEALLREAPVGRTLAVRLILNPHWSDVSSAIGGGPVLVRAGKPVFRALEAFPVNELSSRRPRAAVGQRADGRILLMAVDGRQPGYSAGLTNFELALALVRLGAVNAGALGAGNFVSMAFEGATLNRPPAGRQPLIGNALLLQYLGVHALPPAEAILSPNADGVAERQELAYKVVQPSSVTATVTGPDGVTRVVEAGHREPGTHRSVWTGLRADGTVEPEGAWRWSVTATDAQGRRSAADRPFALNTTLGFLSVRPAGAGVRISYRLTRPSRVTVTAETTAGVAVRTIADGERAAGPVAHSWGGRSASGRRVPVRTYAIRVVARSPVGMAELSQRIALRRAR